MSDAILYTYKAPKLRTLTDEDRERGIAEQTPPHHPGIPLRDLTAADVTELPIWLQDTLAGSELYDATPQGTRWYNAARRAREPEPEPVAPAEPTTKPTPKAEKE